MRTILKPSGAWEFAWKETSNVGIGSSSCRPCPFRFGLFRLLSALKDLWSRFNRSSKAEVGYGLTSQVSKKRIGRLDQESVTLWSDRADHWIAFSREKIGYGHHIAHDIRTFDHCIGLYPTNHQRRDAEEEKLKKIASNLQVVSKRLESLLEYRRLMEGAIQPGFSDVDLSQVLTQQLFQYYDSLTEAGIALEVELEEHSLCDRSWALGAP